MSWPVARAVLFTVFACCVAAAIVLHRNERKHEGERKHQEAPPLLGVTPRHPDYPNQPGARLTSKHLSEWMAIEDRLMEDAIDALLDRDEDGAP